MKITPVILCGGSGTRLWPLSRAGFPKQFLCLTGNESLFQQAAKRLTVLETERLHANAPIIVTNEEHRFLTLEQLREIEIEPSAILLEPFGRNTAPALTLAALSAVENGDDPILIVAPADHNIENANEFSRAMQPAIHLATEDKIVTLGIKPHCPDTGYGYIKARTIEGSTSDVLSVESFVEKPDEITARSYIENDDYFWNAGIFVLKASIWLKAIKTFRLDIAEATRKTWLKRSIDIPFVRPDKTEFAAVPSESIDYAVMEHCPGSSFSIAMVPLDAGWSDFGTWDAVWNVLPKDTAGNTHTGDVLAVDTHNTLVHATNRLVSLIGVGNIVVIETPDAILIADKSRSQDVKHVVTTLNQKQREEHALHRKVHRPWGWYDSIDEEARFKVKRIQVKPGASLSLQKHYHRAEHWIVVRGTAEITCGDKIFLLSENQSTYIPLGEVHRLANPGTIVLEIIEVQSGSYLGEDDIVRLKDTYGRKQ